MMIGKRLVLAVVFITLCGFSVLAQAAPSYYVRANGSDNNHGRSEEAAFKTLKKAVAAAGKGTIKTIIVIGTLDSSSEGVSYDDGVFSLSDLGHTGTEEILITGKSAKEKAYLVGNGKKSVIRISGAELHLRFEYIEISGGNDGIEIAGTRVNSVTLGEGVKISGNNRGVNLQIGSLLMLDGATISNNIVSTNAVGGGVLVGNGSFTMSGGTISGNTASDGGGVVVHDPRGSFIMSGGIISDNKANRYGGGVSVESGKFTMTGGAIFGNSAQNGGGVYVWRRVEAEFTQGNGDISDNIASNGKDVFRQ